VSTSTRPRSRRGEGDRLREEILTAAERLLIETGAEEGVSIRAVADAVGVTAPTIYRHFQDKTHLVFEVCARHFEAMDRFVAAATAGSDDPVEALCAMGRAYVQFGTDHPEHYRIMFMSRSEITPEQYAAELLAEGSAFAKLVDGVQACIDAGRFRTTDAFETALHVWAGVHGLTSLLVAKPELPWPDRDRFIEDHIALSLQGLLSAQH
jgi:AcrR family transcriptional regulator